MRRRLNRVFKKVKVNTPVPIRQSMISVPPSFAPSPSHTESPVSSPSTSPTPSVAPTPAKSPLVFSPPKASTPSSTQAAAHSVSKRHTIILVGVVGGMSLILISLLVVGFTRSNKVVTVKPWVTGLSGQLQKAFVSGICYLLSRLY